ncbi:MAG: tyrosine-type recombinase/integrase [Thermoleophilaceae bacterium]
MQRFVDWLTSRPGRNGRPCDRSVANALAPLRAALDAAVGEGLLEHNPADAVVLPRRRGGRAWEFRERRFLTREELARLLDEVPPKWRPLVELLAATGLRISEAIALRWSDLELDSGCRGCGSVGRSFAVSPARPSRATGRGWCRCRPILPPPLRATAGRGGRRAPAG